MNEKNILLLAALGFGAYFILTRKAAAAAARPPTGAGAAQTQHAAPSTEQTLISGGLSLLSQWLGKSQKTQGYDPDTAGEAEDAAFYSNNRDLFASNPPTSYTSYTESYPGIYSL